jgi:hypothetical protein
VRNPLAGPRPNGPSRAPRTPPSQPHAGPRTDRTSRPLECRGAGTELLNDHSPRPAPPRPQASYAETAATQVALSPRAATSGHPCPALPPLRPAPGPCRHHPRPAPPTASSRAQAAPPPPSPSGTHRQRHAGLTPPPLRPRPPRAPPPPRSATGSSPPPSPRAADPPRVALGPSHRHPSPPTPPPLRSAAGPSPPARATDPPLVARAELPTSLGHTQLAGATPGPGRRFPQRGPGRARSARVPPPPSGRTRLFPFGSSPRGSFTPPIAPQRANPVNLVRRFCHSCLFRPTPLSSLQSLPSLQPLLHAPEGCSA